MDNPQIKKVDFAIISAMPDEIAYVNRMMTDGETVSTSAGDFKICNYKEKKILVSAIGMGTTCAAAMSSFILATFKPDYIFFSGTAGGIDSCLNVGDVVIATSAFEAEIQGAFTILRGTDFETALTHPVKKAPLQQSYQMDPDLINISIDLDIVGLPENVKIYKGPIVTTNTFPSPPSLFEQVRAQKPLAIDMETSAVYQTAWMFGAKAIVIRGISNILNERGEDDPTYKTDIHGSSENAAKTLMHVLDKLVISF